MHPPSLRVPYITAWSGEAMAHSLAFRYHPEAGGPRLTYTDPLPTDWMYGVLRTRHGLGRQGQPQWLLVNALRQWRCMEHGLCQVCGESAADSAMGHTWWLLVDDVSRTTPDRGYTNAPPTCPSCIPTALKHCPRLRKGAALYTVADAEPWAVLGHVFRPTPAGDAVIADRNVRVLLEEYERLTRTLAHQLIVLLDGLRRRPFPTLA